MIPDDPCLIRQCIRLEEPRLGMVDVLVLILVAAVVLGALIGYLHWKHDYFARVRARSSKKEEAMNPKTYEPQPQPRSTVEIALDQLRQAKKDLDSVRFALTETNSYADGPRLDLDRAFETIEQEIERSIAYWSAP